MPHGSGNPRFRDDDGSADPAAAAALSAFAAAQGSEHAALTALARARLLVPVVAVLSDGDRRPPGPAAGAPAAGGEKNSEMAMPTLLGRDGRAAIPVFTGLDALARWQPCGSPGPRRGDPGLAGRGVQDACAVIIDIAGPVPLAVEGARLAALAQGQPVPLPYEDPDIREVVAALVAQAAGGAEPASFTLRPAPGDGDLLIELAPPAGMDPGAVQAFASQVGSAILERLGHRLRRGIALALAQP